MLAILTMDSSLFIADSSKEISIWSHWYVSRADNKLYEVGSGVVVLCLVFQPSDLRSDGQDRLEWVMESDIFMWSKLVYILYGNLLVRLLYYYYLSSVHQPRRWDHLWYAIFCTIFN